MRLVRSLSLTLMLVAVPLSAAGAAGVVIGDSIGVGVSEVSGLHNFARNGIHIRGPRALEQMRAAPPNSTAYVVLGTNDAEGSIQRLDKYIDDLTELAAKKHISIVWLGPPCVRKAWDSRARELDAMLNKRFAGSAVKYVSMRDKVLCSGKFQEPDGVHLKRPGYVYMWQKAQAAAQSDDFALAALDNKAAPAATVHKVAAGPEVTGSLAGNIAVPAMEKGPAEDEARHTRTVFIFPRATAQ